MVVMAVVLVGGGQRQTIRMVVRMTMTIKRSKACSSSSSSRCVTAAPHVLGLLSTHTTTTLVVLSCIGPETNCWSWVRALLHFSADISVTRHPGHLLFCITCKKCKKKITFEPSTTVCAFCTSAALYSEKAFLEMRSNTHP